MRKLKMARGSCIAICLLAIVSMTTSVWGDSSEINALRIEKVGGTTSYIVSKVGAVDVQNFVMTNPPRLVVDFIGARHAMPSLQYEGDGEFVDRVRTSQFADEPASVTRVVFDLTMEATHHVKQTDEAVTITFSHDGGKTATAEEVTAPPEGSASMTGGTMTSPSDSPEPPAQPSDGIKPKIIRWNDQEDPVSSSGSVSGDEPSGDTPEPRTKPNDVPTFAMSGGLQRNQNITIDVQNADIMTVLRSFSEFSGTNIIAGPEVEGDVTAHLQDVPWREAMDVILKANGYGWREEYGVIRVSTIEKLTKEELELQAAERKKDDLLPLHTQIIPLSYSNAEELRDALKEMLTQRGDIEVDRGSNSLIVRDIEKSLDKIASMVEELDRKTKQVEIVAKMVDVDFEATREMGVRWDAINLNVDDVNAVGDAIIDARVPDPVGVFRIGTVQSWGELQFLLDALERQNKANIISNPRIVTADNREASILVGKEIPLIVSDEAGNPITELTKVGIILRVIPHVNSDNSITLDLHPEVSELASQATVQGGVIISLAEADTRVVVKDGETAVIAGLITEVESSLQSGVPVLMDIPLLGGLFKLNSTTKKKRELITFVTPRIIENFEEN